VARIVGTNGNDSLVGTSSADTIEGLAGNDTLVGLGSSDTLVGGTGADVFVMEAGGGNDTVTDFEDGVDKINVETLATSFAGVTVTADGTIVGREIEDGADRDDAEEGEGD